MTIQQIHGEALRCAGNFKRAEAALLDALQRVDERKVYREMGHASLFAYTVSALRLSDALAFQFISVARKAKEIPELKSAVANGDFTVSMAKKITGVINGTNKQDWLNKAKTLSQRSLELEVAKANPRETVQEMIKPVSAERLEMKLGISRELDQKLNRVRVLLGKQKENVRWEDVVAAMADCYLEKHDPVKRAERSLAKQRAAQVASGNQTAPLSELKAGATSNDPLPMASQVSRTLFGAKLDQVTEKIPAASLHIVNARDRGRCTHLRSDGTRCEETRFTHVHHIIPLSIGGTHEPENLRTLRSHHHSMVHETLGPVGGRAARSSRGVGSPVKGGAITSTSRMCRRKGWIFDPRVEG
ncbi:MAG: HNH endonuclease [Deltaproteobacteria bacterium]|nr:HNH endonuclease [Deltaproteobacteria bacterium]MBI3295413.1 HNH endonuclease [Deltaproteobacteria bacterium]